MVLNHILQRSGSIIKFRSPFQRQGFIPDHFHHVDVMPVPDRLEHWIVKTQTENCRHDRHSQKVVDPEYRVNKTLAAGCEASAWER
jgi:hypothetical protein